MAGPTFMQRALSLVIPTMQEQKAGLNERVASLTRALERDPLSAAAWLSLGEAYLEMDELKAAAESFGRALALAEAQLQTEAWGVVAQAVRDRALRGLSAVRARE